jgi:hypothetical protein
MRRVVGLIAILGHAALAQAQNTTAATSVSTKPASTELTPQEKNLLRHGYKLEVRAGERRFCREEDTLGSRLHTHKVCGSVESLTRRAENNTNQVRDNLQTTVIAKDPNGH